MKTIERNTLTKSQLIEMLKDVPDNYVILINADDDVRLTKQISVDNANGYAYIDSEKQDGTSFQEIVRFEEVREGIALYNLGDDDESLAGCPGFFFICSNTDAVVYGYQFGDFFVFPECGDEPSLKSFAELKQYATRYALSENLL